MNGSPEPTWETLTQNFRPRIPKTWSFMVERIGICSKSIYSIHELSWATKGPEIFSTYQIFGKGPSSRELRAGIIRCYWPFASVVKPRSPCTLGFERSSHRLAAACCQGWPTRRQWAPESGTVIQTKPNLLPLSYTRSWHDPAVLWRTEKGMFPDRCLPVAFAKVDFSFFLIHRIIICFEKLYN